MITEVLKPSLMTLGVIHSSGGLGKFAFVVLLGTFKGEKIGEKDTASSLCMHVCFCWENKLTGQIDISALKCYGGLLVWTPVSRAIAWVSFFFFFKAPF